MNYKKIKQKLNNFGLTFICEIIEEYSEVGI